MNVCDRSGRCFEYVVVNTILKLTPVCNLTIRATAAQKRDGSHLGTLSSATQANYQKCADAIFEWLRSNFVQFRNHQSVVVDRLTDDDAKKGDVTDIRISDSSGNVVVNLSLKHHHHALKHQRPSNTPRQCGYDNSNHAAVTFKQGYSAITDAFHSLVVGTTRFCDLPERSVHENLYKPMCSHVANFINTSCVDPHHAKSLFTFLVGNQSFYKLVYEEHKGQLHITHFTGTQNVVSVEATLRNGSYVDLLFSNGWHLSMRLHTASTDINKNPSLKFDTQFSDSNVHMETQIIRV